MRLFRRPKRQVRIVLYDHGRDPRKLAETVGAFEVWLGDEWVALVSGDGFAITSAEASVENGVESIRSEVRHEH